MVTDFPIFLKRAWVIPLSHVHIKYLNETDGFSSFQEELGYFRSSSEMAAVVGQCLVSIAAESRQADDSLSELQSVAAVVTLVYTMCSCSQSLLFSVFEVILPAVSVFRGFCQVAVATGLPP